MSERILVAGATGALGREVARELWERGCRVVALGRSAARLESVRDWAEERIVADALNPRSLAGVCRGVDRVFSCMGASVIPMPQYGRKTFSQVDAPSNLHLIDEAVASGVKKFVYVSVFGAERLPQMDFVRGHEIVVDRLKASGMEYAVLRATGFFSAMEEILQVASRGLLPQFAGGRPRTNPIHEADLAKVCVDAMYEDVPERDVGGPDPLTRRELGEMAFEAIGKKGRMIPVPVSVLRNAGRLWLPLNPRVGNLFIFISEVLIDDFVAPCYGTRRIADFFAERGPGRAEALRSR
jgi:uncharacterized protein YbjT (DUF2867 family)